MKRSLFVILLVLTALCGAFRLFAVGEKTIIIGASYGWEAVERRSGVIELPLARPHPVLILAGAEAQAEVPPDYGALPAETDPSLDLYLSFDEVTPGAFADKKGRWDLSVSSAAGVSPRPWTRTGEGAARFSGISGSGPLTLRPRQSALFVPGSRVGDFSLEFWFFPMSLENGEELLAWTSSRSGAGDAYSFQRIRCVVLKNRLQWTFPDFFSDPSGQKSMTLVLSGPPVIPKTWSHHLIRFNADLGLLEYLVDGRLESVDYATSTGREGGEVYTPVAGEDCSLVLGNQFSGLMDEFRIYSCYRETPALARYLREGRVETRTLDLGKSSGRLLKIEAFGGQSAGSAGNTRNWYAGNGSLRFADHSELNFFVRTNNTPYLWNDVPWVPVKPGEDLPSSLSGRFIQVAADFYPSGDRETSPYLDELRIIYRADDLPPPPALVIAAAKDGAVELSWKASPGRNVEGYLVYYGVSSGEYFGDHAIIEGRPARSPVNAGNRTKVRIEGLNNGTLYYFAVAAYDGQGSPGSSPPGGFDVTPEAGDFSRETAARPLRMVE
ncbi:MAG: fibronectin type III domain-containing protein [Treponema sp.]|jgi:hypothetical protein|nr:fibronectin type III domain-containing protein [Treponema sp.]